MKAYKFVVPDDRFRTLPSDEHFMVKGCAAVVIAEDAAAARQRLRTALLENGQVPWEEVADMTTLPLDVPGVLLIVQM